MPMLIDSSRKLFAHLDHHLSDDSPCTRLDLLSAFDARQMSAVCSDLSNCPAGLAIALLAPSPQETLQRWYELVCPGFCRARCRCQRIFLWAMGFEMFLGPSQMAPLGLKYWAWKRTELPQILSAQLGRAHPHPQQDQATRLRPTLPADLLDPLHIASIGPRRRIQQPPFGRSKPAETRARLPTRAWPDVMLDPVDEDRLEIRLE